MDFNTLVRSIVEPELHQFGFTMKQELKGQVKYANSHCTISFLFDYSYSCEVDVMLQFKESTCSYGYQDLKQYFDKSERGCSAIQIINESVMTKWLDEVKRFLKDTLASLIDNYAEVEAGLDSIRQHELEKYNRTTRDRLLNEGVDKYWMAKDYSGLVRFLKNKGELGRTIQKKYEFAMQKIAKP